MPLDEKIITQLKKIIKVAVLDTSDSTHSKESNSIKWTCGRVLETSVPEFQLLSWPHHNIFYRLASFIVISYLKHEQDCAVFGDLSISRSTFIE